MEDYELTEERERQAFVQELIDRDMLEGAAQGVAKKYVADGYGALSDKQRHVLDTHVIEAHMVRECSLCHESIPWSEQSAALDNGGECGHCVYKWNKVMNEE